MNVQLSEEWTRELYPGREPREMVNETVDLPRHLAELRDGVAPPAKNAGIARAKRLAQMERDLIALVEFASDLDRYIDHAKTAPLVGNGVGPYMAGYLKTLRAQVSTKGQELHAELTYLRGCQ